MAKCIILGMLLSTLFSFPAASQGFLKKLQEKAENKASEILVRKSGEKAEKALDGKKDSKNNAESTTAAKESSATANGSVQKSSQTSGTITAYSKFDFVPGDTVVFSENFERDAIGEFPLNWFTKSGGEVVTLEGLPGKWLKLTAGETLSPTVKFPDDFTFEFDVLINLPTQTSAVYPGLHVELFDRGDQLKKLGYGTYTLKNSLRFEIKFHQKFGTIQLTSRENAQVKLMSDKINLPHLPNTYGSVAHVALSIQKERLRLWIDADKVLDLPIAVAKRHQFNQLLVSGALTGEGNPAFYYSDFKLSSGIPDMRALLLNTKHYTTQAILFDTNTAVVKPMSYGIIKAIAAVIKENPNLKITIIGHTDSDGSADANLELSKQRATAVKQAMVDLYQVPESAVQTDGKGATQPIADNSSSEGKAKNRRVEFILL